MSDGFFVTGIPTPPKGVEVLRISYRVPRKHEWFLSRYSDDWVQCENKNGVKKQQRHLTITAAKPPKLLGEA